MNYLTYTVQDFVKDAFFQRWVLKPDDESNAYWRTWLVQYPHKRAVVEEARELIIALNFQTDIESNKAFLEVWSNINAEKRKHEKVEPQESTSFTQWLQQHQQLAALFIGVLLLSCGLVFWLNVSEEPEVRYATQYGQTNTIILPDSSIVTLNANSSIAYTSNWDIDQPREVWLTGEAFFKVLKKKTQGDAKFQVHAEGLTVEVLGTQFNVNSRRKKTRVVLNSGKVRLNLDKGTEGPGIVMQPGDFVEYSEEDGSVKRKRVDVEFFSSWVDNKLLFNKTTLREIAELVKDTYGIQIIFRDVALADKKFTGMVPADDVDLLLETLKKLYDLETVTDSNQIIFTPSKQIDSMGA